MKLLNCTECNDITQIKHETRFCRCKKSSAFYVRDGRTVNYAGPCRILGILNQEYRKAKVGDHYQWFVIPESSEWINKVG